MSDTYKLVYRGEILEGQHAAVVRKRLGSAAGFQDAQLDKLFSGQPVILKREADTATAARLQALFKQAGARLRVLPVDGAFGSNDGAPGGAEAGTTPANGPHGAGDFEVLPAGSELLRQGERQVFVPRDVDTSALSLEGARFAVPEATAEAAGPDVSHLSLAESGSLLADPAATPAPVPVPDYDLADAGVDLGQLRVHVEAPLKLDELDFEVAPAGSALAPPKPAVDTAVPDTSRLTLAPADSADDD